MKKAKELVARAVEKIKGEKGREEQGSSSKNDVSRYSKDFTKGTFASKSFDELAFSPDVEANKYTKYQREYFGPEDFGSGQHTSWQQHLRNQERIHDDIPQEYNGREDQDFRVKKEEIKKHYNRERKKLSRDDPDFAYKDELLLEARTRDMQDLRDLRNLAATTAEFEATMRSRRERRDRIDID